MKKKVLAVLRTVLLVVALVAIAALAYHFNYRVFDGVEIGSMDEWCERIFEYIRSFVAEFCITVTMTVLCVVCAFLTLKTGLRDLLFSRKKDSDGETDAEGDDGDEEDEDDDDEFDNSFESYDL